jgi:WbqC-like protein family
MNVVISQPMFFPWVGFLEQIKRADVYVHYDDVQFSKGSFTNRVQIKTPEGFAWLTVPLHNLKLGQNIMDVRIDNSKDWRARHLEILSKYYAAAPYAGDMLGLVRAVYSKKTELLIETAVASMAALLDYFGIAASATFFFSSAMGIPGKGSQRVLDVVKFLGGTTYITGHGARNYLDHEAFEARGIKVEYINYLKSPYPQLYGPFNPFVSSLDLIANRGKAGRDMIRSATLYWKEFLAVNAAAACSPPPSDASGKPGEGFIAQTRGFDTEAPW